ncbi:MAG: hypothetical protein KF764_09130 [Labilithrix sp.]|nr:hypothetical protein [Labilithrix sp.]
MSFSGVLRAALLCSLVVACSSQRPAETNAAAPPAPSPGAPATKDAAEAPGGEPSPAGAAGTAADAAGSAGSAGVAASAADEEPPIPEPSFDEVARVLFADRASPTTAAAACPSSTPPDARVRCLFDERYRGDAKSASLAHELFVRWRVVAGVEVAHTMNGGYRGMIRIEPALPIGAERKHIEWIVSAMHDFEAFFADLDRHHPVADAAGGAPASRPKRYRWKPVTLRFMRSVAARTPSAYAHDWTVAWNLAGSLHRSADAVRETLFHEMFHLNDYAHPPPGGEAWSFHALGATFDAIVKRCGTAIPCLGPYSPNDTIVRGGTYYSFQPGNGVREYAAELAVRYYREQREQLRARPHAQSTSSGASPARAAPSARGRFKCGPPENARAWTLMRDEFFGGVDAVPPCGS